MDYLCVAGFTAVIGTLLYYATVDYCTRYGVPAWYNKAYTRTRQISRQFWKGETRYAKRMPSSIRVPRDSRGLAAETQSLHAH